MSSEAQTPTTGEKISWSESVSILSTQYAQAIQLYQHEDNLTWKKLQQAVYVNGALAALCGTEMVHSIRWMVACGAAVLCALFLITVEGSRRYMHARLAAVCKAERALCGLSGSEPVIKPVRARRGVPTTGFSIRVFLWLTTAVWVSLASYWFLAR